MIEEEDHPQHPDERWLVSYADFITLLFALFVLLYALSNSSKAKEAAGMNSVAKAVGIRPGYGSGGTRPGLAQSQAKMAASPELTAIKAAVAAAVKQYPNWEKSPRISRDDRDADCARASSLRARRQPRRFL